MIDLSGESIQFKLYNHQHTNDFNTLAGHLENFERLYGRKKMAELKEITADIDYGNEQNYELLEQKIRNFLITRLGTPERLYWI